VSKLKLALYWAASCGGCEIAVLDLGERILDVVALADIVFWPVALDFKYADVEAMADKSIDVCLFNGAIRNSEGQHIAELLRAKSKVLVAFGACAAFGGIPALANASTRERLLNTVYSETASTVQMDGIRPKTHYAAPEGELHLPYLYNTVRTLDQVVPVDYFQPGCPPETEQIWNVIQAIASGQLPPVGSVVGALDKSCCDECERVKEEKKVKAFHTLATFVPEKTRCLLEQGVVCCGPATRGGCGARCLKANMPCRGCYGPAPGVKDQGAKLVSAIGAIIDSEDPAEIESIIAQIPDPLGTFYRFGFANSLLVRAKIDQPGRV
jgi:F420-non-reducing hydrogenase small subunit